MTDQLGSVRDLIDNDGTVRMHRQFDSYGNITAETYFDTNGFEVTEGQTGYFTIAFGFTGKLFDVSTGLQNNINRWYDATVGRWASQDPIGFEAGDANLYRYVGNESTIYVDPDGLMRLTLEDIQATYDRSQKIVDRIREANPKDHRLLFLDTQQSILAELAKGQFCGGQMSAEEIDWLGRILNRFMGSLNNALEGRIQPGTGADRGAIMQGIRDRRAGKVGGPWWEIALRSAMNADKVTAGNDTWIGRMPGIKKGTGLTPNAQEAAAIIMATAHIHFDLKMAILEEGYGTNRVWNCIGDVVERSAKKHGRGLTNWLNGTMPRMSNTGQIDPMRMRNAMRTEVIKYFDYLRKDGKWTSNDPHKGLSGTDLLPF